MASTALATQPNRIRTDLQSVTAKESRVVMDLQSAATTVNDLCNALKTGAPDDVIPDVPLLALYDEARVLCGMSQKEMAINAGVNEGTFSQAWRGQGQRKVQPEWIDRQPRKYKVALTTLMQRNFGVVIESRGELLLIDAKASIDTLTRLLERTVVSA